MKIKSAKNIIALVLTIMLSVSPCMAADDDSMNEYLVKAAFLYNFAKFVEWPPCQGQTCSEYRLVIGFYGWEGLGSSVKEAFDSISGKTVGKKVISIKYVSDPAELLTCQMVYLFSSKTETGHSLLDRFKGLPILTISDEEDFVYGGGMIELIKVGSKLRFSINRKAALEASINISSQLLKLALNVVE